MAPLPSLLSPDAGRSIRDPPLKKKGATEETRTDKGHAAAWRETISFFGSRMLSLNCLIEHLGPGGWSLSRPSSVGSRVGLLRPLQRSGTERLDTNNPSQNPLAAHAVNNSSA